MYTIKQAAALSGVGVSLLRAWERRYGVVTPARSPGGYRLYDDDAIARLRSMRQLVDGGWAASQAAEAVLAGPVEPPAPLQSAVAARADIEAFLTATATYDTVGIESVLDAFFSRGSFEAVIDDLVLPAVAALGPAWASGRIDVAAEHLASATVQRRLAALFDLGGAPGPGPAVIVGLPPGCRHEIGTLAFAVALRRQGVNVLYLGPDVPISSWVHVVRERSTLAVIIGVAVPEDVDRAEAVAAAIQEAHPRVIIAIGGPTAHVATSDIRILGDRVTDAALEVARLVRTR
ncbi:MAG: MerR family transcriptional regulator [Chloroflexota bacterium]|nr:MAG: MerR family transcriptional regulator [Chloroflexota bacterium]